MILRIDDFNTEDPNPTIIVLVKQEHKSGSNIEYDIAIMNSTITISFYTI